MSKWRAFQLEFYADAVSFCVMLAETKEIRLRRLDSYYQLRKQAAVERKEASLKREPR